MRNVPTAGILLLFTGGLMCACDDRISSTAVDRVSDSCAHALKADVALGIGQAFGPTKYSGELNNYWGGDTSRLDFKQVIREGELVQAFTYYYSGQVQEEFNYRCASVHGLQKWYHENGRLAQVISYRYGYRHGLAFRYDSMGNETDRMHFVNDSIREAEQLPSTVKHIK